MRALRSLAPILPSVLSILLLALVGVTLDRHVYDTIGFPGINGVRLVGADPVSGDASDGSDLPNAVDSLGFAGEQVNARLLQGVSPRGPSSNHTLAIYVDTATSVDNIYMRYSTGTPSHTYTFTEKVYYTHGSGSIKTLALTSTVHHFHVHNLYDFTAEHVTSVYTTFPAETSNTLDIALVNYTTHLTKTVSVFETGLPPSNVTADNTSVVFADYTTTVPHIPIVLDTLRPTCNYSTVPGATVLGTVTETKTITSSVFETVTITVDAASQPSKI